MVETPAQIYVIAATVLGGCLFVLGLFVREGIATSKAFDRGVNLYQQKDYKGAEVAFRQIISRHPSNDMVHLLLGDVLMQQGSPEEAIAEFQEVIRLTPKNVDAYLRLGNALGKQHQLEKAIAALETARDLFQAQQNPKRALEIEQFLKEVGTQQNHG